MTDQQDFTGVPIGAEALPVAPAPEEPAKRVVLSPTDTRGRWKNFTEYLGSDPEYDLPGIRADGWVDPEGIKWVRASGPDRGEIRVVFEDAFLPPIDLVRIEDSIRFANAVKRSKKQHRELNKRGL